MAVNAELSARPWRPRDLRRHDGRCRCHQRRRQRQTGAGDRLHRGRRLREQVKHRQQGLRFQRVEPACIWSQLSPSLSPDATSSLLSTSPASRALLPQLADVLRQQGQALRAGFLPRCSSPRVRPLHRVFDAGASSRR